MMTKEEYAIEYEAAVLFEAVEELKRIDEFKQGGEITAREALKLTAETMERRAAFYRSLMR